MMRALATVMLLVALAITFAPLGILTLFLEAGAQFPVENEMAWVIGFILLASILAGIAATSGNTRFYRIVIFSLLGLAIANACGCYILLQGLSKITSQVSSAPTKFQRLEDRRCSPDNPVIEAILKRKPKPMPMHCTGAVPLLGSEIPILCVPEDWEA